MITNGQPIQSPVVQCAHCEGQRTRLSAIAVLADSEDDDQADFHCCDCGRTTRIQWSEYVRAQLAEQEANR